MNISELKVRDRVLVQSGRETKEHAVIMEISEPENKVLVRLSDYSLVDISPYYILKIFKRGI